MRGVHPMITEFRRRFSDIGTRMELLALEQDLMSFLTSDEYGTLSEEEKNLLDEIVVELLSRKEHFNTGCDPWESTLKRNWEVEHEDRDSRIGLCQVQQAGEERERGCERARNHRRR
jgi:phosphoribosylamine-glycine ligase